MPANTASKSRKQKWTKPERETDKPTITLEDFQASFSETDDEEREGEEKKMKMTMTN